MANRFERLFQLPENQYTEGAPVILAAGALLKDSETGKIVVQLKIQSVSEQPIKAVKVSLAAFDVMGADIQGVPDYQYLDLNVSNGQIFGTNKAIMLPMSTTRSFAITSIVVIFHDGSTWSNDHPFTALPGATSLDKALKSAEMKTQYRIATNEAAEYVPQEDNNLWQCACGTWNGSSVCTHCRLVRNKVFSAYDIPVLNTHMAMRIETEKAEEAHRRDEAKAKNRRIRISIVILAAIMVFAIVFTIVQNSVIIPNEKYNDAIALMDAGQYTLAITAFEELGGYKDCIDKIEECYVSIYGEDDWNIIKNWKFGDTYVFGSYEQDNKKSNGKEDIEWLILDQEGTRIFVVSKYALDYQKYNTTLTDITWHECSLREWLNNDFYNTAFSEDEKAAIPTVWVEAEENPRFSKETSPGFDTQDKVFLLSISEANLYFRSNEARQCEYTAYVKAQIDPDSIIWFWWLRTPGEYQRYAACVSDGHIYEYGTFGYEAVRPALWIDLSKTP